MISFYNKLVYLVSLTNPILWVIRNKKYEDLPLSFCMGSVEDCMVALASAVAIRARARNLLVAGHSYWDNDVAAPHSIGVKN